MDGTVFLGDRLLPGTQELLDLLRARQIPHYFLTNNSSRARVEYQAKLNQLGLQVTLEQVFSSGQATALYLQQR